MRFIFSALILFFTNVIYCQSLSEAETHFNRFEYVEAITILESFEGKSVFKLDQLKQLGYSYYAIGDFKKALPVFDSILKFKPLEPHFYLLKGESLMANGNSEKAIESFELFQELYGKTDVSLRIAAAKEMSSWKSMDIDSISESSLNSNKATVLGSAMSNGSFVFKEVGVNREGKFLSEEEDINTAELLLMRPYFLGESLIPITILGGDDFWSIIDIALEPNTNKALVSLAKPVGKEEWEKVIRIYEGTYNPSTYQLEIIKPWNVLGAAKHSTAGFASFNKSGTVMAFSLLSDSSAGVDIYWMKKNIDGIWGGLTSLNTVNSEGDDVFPRFLGDTLLTFSSNGRMAYGGLDIYKVRLAGQEIVQGSLEHLPFPVNSFRDDYNMQFLGDTQISLTSNRLGRTTDDNILYMYPTQPVEEEPVAVVIDPNIEFLAKWEAKNLYFNFDDFSIKRDSKEIDFSGLKAVLAANPNFKIKLTGKTDNRGTEEYNYQLGLKRAQSVKTELVSFGFNSNQIEVLSKGMNEPIVDCSNSWGCSEVNHAKNRLVLIDLEK